MSDSGFNIPKATAAQMVREAFGGTKFQTVASQSAGGNTMKDDIKECIQAYTNDLSGPLKKMKAVYF